MNSQTTDQPAQNAPAMPEITVKIVVQTPDSKPETQELRFGDGQNRLRVGRDGQNEFYLKDASVSKFHAALLMKPDGTLLVSDLNSSNGTFLNGKRLTYGKIYEVAENDVVAFGDASARFNWKEALETTLSPAEATQLIAVHETLESEALPLPTVLDKTAPPKSIETGRLEQIKQPAQSVAKSAGIVSIAVMGSRVMGLVREMVFARFFGAGFLYDAFLVGFRIPNLLRDLFAEGALSAAFVKVFTDYQIKRSEEEAWRLASLIFNALVVVLSVVVILGMIFSRQIVGVIAAGYSPEKAALAATLTQIMFPFVLLVALAALAMGVLNTKGKFGIPASASTAFNIVSLIVGLGVAYWLSGGGWEKSGDKNLIPSGAAQWAIIGMAIGTLIGGAAQFLIQVPSLWRTGFRFRFALNFRDEGVRRIGALMAPALLGVSAVQIKVLIETFLISGIDGGQSWLSYSFRLMQFPIGVFGVALGTAAVPTLSRFAAQGDFGQFRKTLSGAINLVFLLTIPSACGLIVLGEPIIRLIYEGGEFDAADTRMTAFALMGYSIGLTGYAAIKIISPAFYALDDAKTPMYVSVTSILIHVVVGFSMLKVLSNVGVTPENPNGLAHVGVTLATSTVALSSFFALIFLMRRKVERLEGRSILSSFIKIAFAAALMSAVCYGVYWALAHFLGTDGLLVRLLEVFAPMALGGGVFLIAAKLLGVKELNQAVEAVLRKLKIKK